MPLLTLFHRHRQRGEEIVSARQPFTRGMVLCSSCRVNNIDRHCTNTPRACYQCCTSHPTIHTCPPHYQQMGISDAAARLASGLVHPNVVEDAGEGLPRTDSNPQNGGPSSGAESQSSNDSSAQLKPNHGASGSASGASAAAGAPLDSAAASASSLAALRAGMEADKAATQVQLAALQAQLTAQEASTQRLMALLEARLPTLPQTTSPPAPTSSSAPATGASHPHRQSVLDRSALSTTSRAEVTELVNKFAALTNEDSDDDTHEVAPHTHTLRTQLPTKVLPAAFIPTPSGSEQSAQQQLAAIVHGLSKQGSKVKYANIAELSEALDDWATDSLKAGWTATQVESIRALQRLLVVRFSVSERRPLKEVLEYHRKWCKAVHAGTIDMFTPGAELNLAILYDVSNPMQLSVGHTSTTSSHKTSGAKKAQSDAAPGTGGVTRGSPITAKHPPGSCTNHPNSTTHTTAECKKK